MSTIRAVNEAFAVADQVRPEEIPALAARFAVLINNRPDGEEPGQPVNAELEAAARAAGVRYVFAPVSGAPGPEQVQAVVEALRGASGPALAFCRTGTRSIVTWAVGEALGGRPASELVADGATAGYDLGPPLNALLPRFRA